MGKIKLVKVKEQVPFRKIAMGTWSTPKDPSVYGLIELDMQPALDFIQKYSAEHAVKITPSHLVAQALSQCFNKRPEINSIIRFNKIYQRESVRLFFQVNIQSDSDDAKKANLSGCSFDGVEKMSLKDIAENLISRAGKVKQGKDKELKKSIGLLKWMLWGLTKHYLNLSSFLIYTLNLDLSRFGFPKDPFGSAMITNVGGMGIETALVPLCAYTRTPMLLAVGAVEKRPCVVDDKVEVRPMMNIGVTFDHRLIDGVHCAEMLKMFKKYFKDPEKYFF